MYFEKKKIEIHQKKKKEKKKDGLMKTWPIPKHSNIHSFILGKAFLANF
jgi:hypothetical protein